MCTRLVFAPRGPLFAVSNGHRCIRRPMPLPVSSIFIRRGSSENGKKKAVEESVVYVGNLKHQVVAVKILSLASSVVGLALQPFLMYKMLETNMFIAVAFGTFSVFFIVFTPLLFHVLTRRYVLRLTFNPETKNFVATTYTLFVRKKTTVFTAKDVVKPETGLITTFFAKRQPMFIDPSEIKDMNAFKHLMGYDKPVDFFLETDKKKEEK